MVVDTKPVFVKVMAWHCEGIKPLPKPMLTMFYDVIWTDMDHNELHTTRVYCKWKRSIIQLPDLWERTYK